MEQNKLTSQNPKSYQQFTFSPASPETKAKRTLRYNEVDKKGGYSINPNF